MEEYLGDSASATNSRIHMKAKLEEHFSDQIIITEINGKPNVVTFRSTVTSILHEFNAQQKYVDPETENLNIIRTASRLIKNDIKLIKTSKFNEIYPLIKTEAETNANFLPKTLKLFLEGIIVEQSDGPAVHDENVPAAAAFHTEQTAHDNLAADANTCLLESSYPTALFDSPLMLRQPQKPLADALWAKLSPDAMSGPAGDVQYVLDGGALLH
ncbi:hypothetical protein OS493_030403 [Desmophyllum pertusum]|uniref:Uncharacterized protein n=1 Tax=Desmophyllum pertusum TaxID=174260 RepID=A0A9X0CWR2_9CNID|nr:hypothetical protein OS493_030403 [Desmophyllum pertusum]